MTCGQRCVQLCGRVDTGGYPRRRTASTGCTHSRGQQTRLTCAKTAVVHSIHSPYYYYETVVTHPSNRLGHICRQLRTVGAPGGHAVGPSDILRGVTGVTPAYSSGTLDHPAADTAVPTHDAAGSDEPSKQQEAVPVKFRVERDVLADAVAWAARSPPGPSPRARARRPAARGREDGALGSSPASTTRSRPGSRSTPRSPRPARVLVSGRLLADICRSLPNKPWRSPPTAPRSSLTCGSARFTLPTMPVEDYPALPTMPTARHRRRRRSSPPPSPRSRSPPAATTRCRC